MDALSLATAIIHHILGMAWKVGWGLVLGFAISGAIQAFISKSRIAEHLGEVSVRSVLLASGFGAASSSCSYAAASMSKSLYKKGAHIVTATAFLFASTNLVLEIGLIIWVLMGWRFVAAEFLGGMLLIGVVTVLLNWFAPKSVFDDARRHLTESEARAHDHDHDHGGGGSLPLRSILTFKGVRAMARYYTMDFRMVGKDIILGLVMAGVLAAVVPRDFWATLFLSNHGGGHPSLWVSLENAVVGPLIAVLSFVCSVGNIPLAAVLWNGGISFGGVVAFIFADLVTIPMVLVYRRYYGWRPALMYSGYLLVTMIVTALMVEYLFRWTGLAPETVSMSAPGIQDMDYFAWDYTALLNLVILPLGAWLGWVGAKKDDTHHATAGGHGE
ncbi:MAG TPA: permease [Longimicrobiales bacterium]|nr:permease [Longimicrobiales bacterium]